MLHRGFRIYIYIHYEWCHTAVCSRRKVNVEEGGQGGQHAVLITKKKKFPHDYIGMNNSF